MALKSLMIVISLSVICRAGLNRQADNVEGFAGNFLVFGLVTFLLLFFVFHIPYFPMLLRLQLQLIKRGRVKALKYVFY